MHDASQKPGNNLFGGVSIIPKPETPSDTHLPSHRSPAQALRKADSRLMMVIEPGMDGAFTHLDALTRWLLSRGHAIDLAYSSIRSGPSLAGLVGHILASGGATLDLHVSNGLGPSDIAAYRRLRNFVAARRPGLIHAHSSKAGGYVRLLPSSLAPCRFYSPHAYYGLRPGRSLGGGFFNRIERLLARRAFTINVSESEAGFASTVLGIPASRRATVPNGVNMHRFHPASRAERLAARARLGLPPEGKVLLSVARLCFQKDPHTLYRAFHAAADQVPDLHLLHLCTGPERQYGAEALRGPHRDRIHCFHEQQDPLPFYHAADGFILSSRYEGLPLVVLEAMSCGLPLILSAVSGNDDILYHKPDAALWFVAQDHHRAASCIQEWIQKVREENNHRDIVREFYSSEASHLRIEQLYAQEAHVST